MNLRELLETAHLDALGLLDEQEQRDFDVAFAAASPGVRAQVRAEQARWARTASRLHDEDPPAALRSKVIERVMTAVDEELGSSAAAERPESGSGSVAGRGMLLTLGMASRVSPLWRATSVGFATAALVCLGVLFHQLDQSRKLEERIAADQTLGRASQDFGPGKYEDMLFAQSAKRIVFTPVAERFGAKASIFVNADWRESMLMCQGLPTFSESEGKVYRLVYLNERNEIVGEPAGEFASEAGRLWSVRIAHTFAAGTRLAIAASSRSAPTVFSDVVLIATVS